MKIDNNKYALKTYIINRTSELIDFKINNSEHGDKYDEALKVLSEIRAICDNRGRY